MGGRHDLENIVKYNKLRVMVLTGLRVNSNLILGKHFDSLAIKLFNLKNSPNQS